MPTVEVFAEIGCPFTHVGLRRFVQRRTEAGRDDIRLRVRSWPLEFVNGEALDGEFIAEEIAELRFQTTPDLFGGFDPSVFPATSIPAMTLACAANAKGTAVGEAISLELRDRLFEHGEDVADPFVLAGIAAEYGVGYDPEDTSAVAADYEEGIERGVVGSPHFFTPEGAFFCPTLHIRRIEGQLHIDMDPDSFDEFVEICLRS